MKEAILNFLIKKVLIVAIEKLAVILPQLLLDWSNEWKKKHREKVQEQAQKKYDEVSAKPESTAEEKIKAYEELINSGRF